MITADVYKTAAMEHVTIAGELYRLGRYALCHYVSGLAVECIFRAYRCRVDPEFDARHDLDRLYKIARFEDVVPSHHQPTIGTALTIVALQWSNKHRFRSEDALRAYLVRLKLYQGIKGDFVKERSRRIWNAATEIVTVGVGRWTH